MFFSMGIALRNAHSAEHDFHAGRFEKLAKSSAHGLPVDNLKNTLGPKF